MSAAALARTPKAHQTPMPGLLWGSYPERAENHDARAPHRPTRARQPIATRVARVHHQLTQLAMLDDTALDDHRHALQPRWAMDASHPRHVEQAVTLTAEIARRTLGKTAYDGQLAAALQLLDERLVEMATGEGKSLATAIAAAAAALSGMPVHVITANDYLVQRDAEVFHPLFKRLGLQVAAVTTRHQPEERRYAYASHVVYVTAKELVFDYLRDRTMHQTGAPALRRCVTALGAPAASGPLLRGLCMAIIDEADSVLIDEALMPLILSRENNDAAGRAYRWQAWTLSSKLTEGADFICHPAMRQATLTNAGRERIATITESMPPLWRSTRHREHAICTALAARHLYQRDRDYIVQYSTDEYGRPVDRIVIVDAVSGRLSEGRRWSQGLHAMVALKEGCKPEPELETIAQITYQRFFRRYHRLGGLSGTLSESRAELRTLYGLQIVAVAPRLPPRRQIGATRAFASADERWAAVARRCTALTAQGRPVLVGTDSVAESQDLSAVLTAANLAHTVLNAHHDADEAAIVARAGEPGRITVATNMAGRGTDIEVNSAVCAAGGLHVLSCQLNPSRRIDRQLLGRAARQGQNGSAETWIALDSQRLAHDAWGRLSARLMTIACTTGTLHHTKDWRHYWLQLCLHAVQHYDEYRHARARTTHFWQDCAAERKLSFSQAT
ncbi:DEAD/DEAH box helicase [Azonexus sp.]|uniref:preprotein translocase subunit SecA n=1 Tax=Azonexus sp. TaxID=1872668 RepID=UPI0039E2E21C